MRKPTHCQLCQVVQHLKCHCGFLFCSLSPKQESQTPLPTGPPALFSFHFQQSQSLSGFPTASPVQAATANSACQQERARANMTVPGPGGSRQRGAIPSHCCRHAAVPPCPPVLVPSSLQEKYFSFFLLPGSSSSAYFQWVSSSSGWQCWSSSCFIPHPGQQ